MRIAWMAALAAALLLPAVSARAQDLFACGPHMLMQPIWAAEPTADALIAAYPEKAAEERKSGEALLDCGVKADGALVACRIMTETPVQMGFGPAALSLTGQYRTLPMKPVEGEPVAANAWFVVRFSEDLLPDAQPPARSFTLPDIEGTWWGDLRIGNGRLPVVLHIRPEPQASTFDSPAQYVRGIPLSEAWVRGDRVKLVIDVAKVSLGNPSLKAMVAQSDSDGAMRLHGRVAQDGHSLSLTWDQSLLTVPIVLNRGEPPAPPAPAARKRPQTPVPPLPYREEEVTYQGAEHYIHIAGTLGLPPGPGPFPAVMILGGSGGTDRDGEWAGHQTYRVLADSLIRRGIAVLRVDKRGVGKSDGLLNLSTPDDYAADARDGLAYLRSRSDIRSDQIGLVGHSEGGLLAPMVAAEDPKVAFVVLLGAPGLRGDHVLLTQMRDLQRAAGVPKDEIEAETALKAQVFDILVREADEAEARREVMALSSGAAFSRVFDLKARHWSGEGRFEVNVGYTIWERWMVRHDPADALRRVKVPVLALGGSKDLWVEPRTNLAAIRAALAGDSDVTVVELPGLNHGFQTARTGAAAESDTLDETFAPSALNRIADWIVARTPPPS